MATRNRSSKVRPDPRQGYTFLAEDVSAGGALRFPHKAGTMLGVVMPVRMANGQVISFPAPRFVAFDLVEAKRHLDRGLRLRAKSLSHLRELDDGAMTITDTQAVLDCFAELVEAVLLSYAALEALVNEMIESLDDSVKISRTNAKGIEVELSKTDMVRRMSTAEKLDTAIPLITGEPSIKGTIFWERFVRLRRIRDALIHIKERGYSNDPDHPSEYGMLLRGDADDCVLDACALVERLRADCLSEAARKALKIPSIGTSV
jgi:hypothetical protein